MIEERIGAGDVAEMVDVHHAIIVERHHVAHGDGNGIFHGRRRENVRAFLVDRTSTCVARCHGGGRKKNEYALFFHRLLPDSKYVDVACLTIKGKAKFAIDIEAAADHFFAPFDEDFDARDIQ